LNFGVEDGGDEDGVGVGKAEKGGFAFGVEGGDGSSHSRVLFFFIHWSVEEERKEGGMKE